MRLESVDSRIVAALRFLDGETALPITSPLTVRGSGVKLLRNHSGLYVLTEAPGFEAYTTQFENPSPPEPVDIPLTVMDPSRRHLPCGLLLKLPRDTSPKPEDPTRSVFEPVDVPMYLSPIARPAPGSARVRLSLKDEQDRPLAGRVIRLRIGLPDKAPLESRGLSDERGEVLLLVPRIPLLRWGEAENDNLLDTKFEAKLWLASAPSVAGLPSTDVPESSFTLLLLQQPLQVASGLEFHLGIKIPTS
jgi:hypothetical protein